MQIQSPISRQPTDEQRAIIEAVAEDKNLLVIALAGTGKTSTLQMIAQAYPQRRGLYLAYNKCLQLEAKGKFPVHVDCKTIHGLAFSYTGKDYAHQLKHRLDISSIVEQLEIEPLKGGQCYAGAYFIASATYDMVKNFIYSIDEQIEPKHYSKRFVDILQGRYNKLTFKLHHINYPKTFLEKFIALTYRYAQVLWERMIDVVDERLPATHDTYLKLYQLSKPVIKGYDYIMLDEAQDANPSILNILSYQNVQQIFVGDKNQQIYEFRGTVNAMNDLEGDTYYLTQSFRFGQAIAQEANKVLKDLGETHLLKGYPSINSKLDKINPQLPYAFLSRSNAGLFEQILKLYPQRKRIHFVGDLPKVISCFESAYYLKIGKLDNIKEQFLQKYTDWNTFVHESDLSNDHEYKGIINFVETYHRDCLTILQKIQNSCRYYEDQAEVIMSTVHKAKGREWQQARINNDFTVPETIEEKCIFYVALTRASQTLEILPQKMNG